MMQCMFGSGSTWKEVRGGERRRRGSLHDDLVTVLLRIKLLEDGMIDCKHKCRLEDIQQALEMTEYRHPCLYMANRVSSTWLACPGKSLNEGCLTLFVHRPNGAAHGPFANGVFASSQERSFGGQARKTTKLCFAQLGLDLSPFPTSASDLSSFTFHQLSSTTIHQ